MSWRTALALVIARAQKGWQALTPRRRQIVVAALLVVLALLISAARAGEVRIPEASLRYRRALEQAAGEQFGLNAPVARLAAQIQTESAWRPTARSLYAEGLAQFTPATARWLPQICPHVGRPDPWDPGWSIRAIACYDHALHADMRPRHAAALDRCSAWAFTLSAYNGGEGWLDRDRRLAAQSGVDPDRWFGEVATINAGRSRSAWIENRSYPRGILLRVEPAYLAAGWPGRKACT